MKDPQAPIDPQTQAEIPGVQLNLPLTTKMLEENTPEEPVIQVDPHESLTEPVHKMEDEYSNPPAAPDEMEIEDSTESMVENTTADPEPQNPFPDQVVQSDLGTNLDPEEEIQQPHRSTRTTRPVTCLQPTMQGQHHHNTTLLNTTEMAVVDPRIMGHIFTQLSLK